MNTALRDAAPGAAASPEMDAALRARLEQACSADALRCDAPARQLAAHDIFHHAPQWPQAVLLPADVASLQRALQLLATAGLAVAPRGGGMSYTGGYLAAGAWVCVDLSRLNRVRELNADDLYLTVEAGCTWAQVRQALAGSGLSTPYGGPLSGLRATVGGALSQNSMFFGAGQHGSAADAVLGLEVLLADGECLRTGSAAFEGAAPFTRWGGPDLTGLFLGDTGAFGIKTAATLRLVPAPAASGYASYGFPSIAAMVGAQVALMRAGLGSETFGIDAYKARHSAQTGNKLASGVKTLGEIARSGSSLMSGLKAAAQVALTGTDYLDVHPYSIHLALDGDSPAHVDERLARVAAIAQAHQGTAQPASVPQVLRAQPFQPLRSVLAHNGDRWVPVHGIVPLSRALATVQAVEALIAQHAPAMAEHGIVYSPLTANTDRAFLFEPCFYWPDEIYPLHVDVLGEALTQPWRARPAAPAARALVSQLWQAVTRCLDEHGAVHFQIGRAYPYLQRLQPATRALVEALKLQLDPCARMNPGSLGLAAEPGPG
ncbi:MAG: FAD-binding oxidoreductase [Rubrivivax sp.]|nr:FAD-binding oxidoreductase [Rubrivivax sp.]